MELNFEKLNIKVDTSNKEISMKLGSIEIIGSIEDFAIAKATWDKSRYPVIVNRNHVGKAD